MCGSPKQSNSAVVEQQQAEAEAARKREEERQARIKQGQESIDRQFGGYDDAYYGRLRQNFLNAARPGVERQQTSDSENLFYNLARAGLQNSSTGGAQRAKLAQGFALQNADLEQNAMGAEQRQRQTINDQKIALENQLRATADPAAAADRATAAAAAIDRTPAYTGGQAVGSLLNAADFTMGSYDRGYDSGYYRSVGTRLFPGASSVRSGR